MWCKLVAAPHKRGGLVWRNRDPELRTSRYCAIDELLARVGVPEPDVRAATVEVRRSRSPEAFEDDLVVGCGSRTARPRRTSADVWAANPDAASAPPWVPHMDSRKLAIGFCHTSGDGLITHMHLNGLPHREARSD